MNVYLDNAATTQPYPEVIEAMSAYLKDEYVNYTWNRFNTSDYVISRRGFPDRDTRINMPNIDKKINANDIRDFLDFLCKHEGLTTSIIPIGDGMSLSVKK